MKKNVSGCFFLNTVYIQGVDGLIYTASDGPAAQPLMDAGLSGLLHQRERSSERTAEEKSLRSELVRLTGNGVTGSSGL